MTLTSWTWVPRLLKMRDVMKQGFRFADTVLMSRLVARLQQPIATPIIIYPSTQDTCILYEYTIAITILYQPH
jgi:hypothetical protein